MASGSTWGPIQQPNNSKPTSPIPQTPNPTQHLGNKIIVEPILAVQNCHPGPTCWQVSKGGRVRNSKNQGLYKRGSERVTKAKLKTLIYVQQNVQLMRGWGSAVGKQRKHAKTRGNKQLQYLPCSEKLQHRKSTGGRGDEKTSQTLPVACPPSLLLAKYQWIKLNVLEKNNDKKTKEKIQRSLRDLQGVCLKSEVLNINEYLGCLLHVWMSDIPLAARRSLRKPESWRRCRPRRPPRPSREWALSWEVSTDSRDFGHQIVNLKGSKSFQKKTEENVWK